MYVWGRTARERGDFCETSGISAANDERAGFRYNMRRHWPTVGLHLALATAVCGWHAPPNGWPAPARHPGVTAFPLLRPAAVRATSPIASATDRGEDLPPDVAAGAAEESELVPEAPAAVSVQERLRLFWRLAVPYFENAEGAKLNFGLMLLLVLINSGISVIFSYVGRDFYSALSAKDQALFLEKTANFALGLAVATPLTVLYKFQRQRLALSWREWMTTELARQYYADQAYYRIEMDREIDNPDQRITEDVAAFTKVSLDFFITLTTSVINLASFSGILYSIYPELFYAIFAYAAFGTASTIGLGKALVGQSAEQLLREADLRYSLVRLRENAESIAFFRGEAQEAAEVAKRLGGAVENRRKIIGTERNLEFFTVAYKYLVQILPVLVVSPLYFAGTIELGVITQSTGAFNNVLNDLSIIVNQFESLSAFSAGLGRLAKFVERMESYAAAGGDGASGGGGGGGGATFLLDEEARAARRRAQGQVAHAQAARALWHQGRAPAGGDDRRRGGRRRGDGGGGGGSGSGVVGRARRRRQRRRRHPGPGVQRRASRERRRRGVGGAGGGNGRRCALYRPLGARPQPDDTRRGPAALRQPERGGARG